MTGPSQVSIEHSFSQAEFDRCARLSGDNNPIHVDAVFASHSRFGRTVAHGWLLCSKLRGLVEQLVPGGRLLDQSVTFEAPTFTGDKMKFSARIVEKGSSCVKFEMEVTRVSDGVVTCSGKGRVVT
jgi:acyl dehydratase